MYILDKNSKEERGQKNKKANLELNQIEANLLNTVYGSIVEICSEIAEAQRKNKSLNTLEISRIFERELKLAMNATVALQDDLNFGQKLWNFMHDNDMCLDPNCSTKKM